MELPQFRYHPDPLGSGSIEASDAECECCGRARGYLYTIAVYTQHTMRNALCPWCIADGSAHRRFQATFVDDHSLAGKVPAPVVDEVTQRTPGYASWQSEEWPVCCHDAAAFLTPAGYAEIQARGLEGEVLEHIVYAMGTSGAAATRLLHALDRDHGPTAYLFQCLHCQRTLVNIDHA